MIVEAPTVCAHPKVSVAMVTYNHAPYIEQAVRSALDQTPSFPFEVVVGDDLSTDGTREKLLNLQRQFPERLRLVLHEKNMGGFGRFNLAATLKHCRGQYVSFLDGDDFYNDPRKLQRQADFLDTHPQCSACFHEYFRLFPDGHQKRYGMYAPGTLLALEQVVHNRYPHILTVMFRRGIFGEYPDWFYQVAMADWSTWLLLAERGGLGFLDGEPMATYRLHDRNYWIRRPLLQRTQDEIFALNTFQRHLGGRFAEVFGYYRNEREFWLVDAYCQEGDRLSAKQAFWRAFWHWWRYGAISSDWVLRYALRAYGVQAPSPQ